MWPILLWFIIGIAIIIERGLYFYLTRQRTASNEMPQTKQSPVDRLQSLARQNVPSNLTQAERRTQLARYAGEIMEEQELRLGVLPILASTAPLLGLLGTIAGIMQAFRSVELAGGAADIAVFAGGIWPALLTTASGLTVAVILHISHGLLNHQVNQRLKKLNDAADIMLKDWDSASSTSHDLKSPVVTHRVEQDS